MMGELRTQAKSVICLYWLSENMVHLARATVMHSNKGFLLEPWVHCHSNGQLINNTGFLH